MENKIYEAPRQLAYDPIDQLELDFDDPAEQPRFEFDNPAPDR